MENVTFVLFGATGDLAKARLLPAIDSLLKKKEIGSESAIIAIGRKEFTDESFKEYSGMTLNTKYLKADIEISGNLKGLSKLIDEIGNKNIIYYLSISYKFFDIVTKQLKRLELNRKEGYNIKIMYEKPFGNNFKSSLKIDKSVHSAFDENEVYRVDHYLGKETVQNLLILRFANPLLESIWNNGSVDRIIIISDEEVGVGQRIAYYDETGALKDMVQNHLLQLASFILMEPPISLDYHEVHNNKVKAIKSLFLKKTEDVLLGQYEGYIEEAARIRPGSNTETFVKLTLFSKLKKWKDVPIVIRTGKKLANKNAEIIIEFKKEPCILYCSPNTPPNRLVIKIHPTQDIILEVNTKKPNEFDVQKADLVFSHDCSFSSNAPKTYEKLICECIKGDKILFPRFDELTEAWKLIDHIESLRQTIKFVQYPVGKSPDA